jgi:hypothetical protein
MNIEYDVDTDLGEVQSKGSVRIPSQHAAAAGGAIYGASGSTNDSTSSVIIAGATNAAGALLPPVASAVYGAANAALDNRNNGGQAAGCAAVGAIATAGAGAAFTVAGAGAGPVGVAVGIVVGNVVGGHVGRLAENACNSAVNYARRKDCGDFDVSSCSYGELTQAIAECEELPAETMAKLGDKSFREKLTTGLQTLHDKEILDASQPLALLGAFESRFADAQSQQSLSQAPTFQVKSMAMT